jgi:hypothetical protein
VYVVVCGDSGSLSSTHFFYLTGSPAPSSGVPVTWYLASAAIYDSTDQRTDYLLLDRTTGSANIKGYGEGQVIIDGSTTGKGVYLNHYVNADVYAAGGGGRLRVGSGTAPTYTLDVTGAGAVQDYFRITNTGGVQSLLMGNQDSGGANNPTVIRSANGTISFGNGNSWTTSGGTVTDYATWAPAGSTLSSNGVGVPALTINTSGTGNWSEGIRINPNANTFAAVLFPVVANSTTAWFVGKLNTDWFAVMKNGFTGSVASRADAAFDISVSTGRTTFGYNPYVGSNVIWHAGNLTNVNQLTNGPGYVSSGGVATFTYVLTTGGGLADNSAGLRVLFPGGAGYVTGTATITGAIKIRLPTLGSNTMLRMTVKIYEYNGTTASTSRTIELGGYNYGDLQWRNTFATQTTHGGGDLNVRFGHDGVKDCIWIGEVGSTWSYPQVFVTDFEAGYSAYTNTTWVAGWTVTFVTAFNTVGNGPTQIARTHTTYSLTNLSQLTNGPGFVTAYYTSPTDFRGGKHMFHSSGTGASTINSDSYAIQVGPAVSRITTANSYYGGIAFNHLLNYSGGTLNADNTSYNISPHAWVGLRLHDSPGSERSFLVFATKPGTGTSGGTTDLPVERMTIDPVDGYVGINVQDPTHRLHVNGDVRFQGDSRAYFGPNSSWSADLVVGGNGRTEATKASVVTTNGNLHMDSANGLDMYLNYYSGRPIYTRGSAFTNWDSGNLTNLSQLTNGPGYITAAGSADYVGGIYYNRIVYGQNATKTTNISNWSTALPSGFYDGSSAIGNPSNDWWHGINVRHNNESNNYAWQMVHNFFGDANVQVRTVNNGSFGTWRSVWMNGGTNGLTNLSQLTNGPGFLGKFGNTYYQLDTWLQITGSHGLYAPIGGFGNAPHLFPNDASYGPWRIHGTKNGWNGLEFTGYISGNPTLMMNSNATGFINPSYGWQWRWSAGTVYINRSTYGGGTEYTAWDSGNLTNLSQLTNGPGFLATGGSPTFQEVYVNGWFRNNTAGNGLYNQATGNHWYSNGSYWDTGQGGTGGIRLRNGHQGTIMGYYYADTSLNSGFLNQSGSWKVRVNAGELELYDLAYANDMRAYIFYDRNDTGYYGDFASTSSFNRVTTRTLASFGLSAKNNTPRWDSTTDTNYWTGVRGWGTTNFNDVMTWGSGFFDTWSSPATSPGDTSHYVGVQAWHYVNGNNSGNGWQIAGGVTDSLWWRHAWSTNSGWFKFAMYDNNTNTDRPLYANTFYDSNNTSYYTNPAGYSQMSSGEFNDYLRSKKLTFIGEGGDSGVGTQAYAIHQESGGWTYPYPDLRIAFHVGMKFGANPSYEGMRFYTDYDMSGRVMQVNGGSNYIYMDRWINVLGGQGLFSSENGAHIYPNQASYGSWKIDGSRNGWGGIEFGFATTTLMMNDNSYGFHRNGVGWKFYVTSGNGYFPGEVTAYWSDRRLKKNIVPLEKGSGLALIDKLVPSSFEWNAVAASVHEGFYDGQPETSLIAQEVREILPIAVAENKAGRTLDNDTDSTEEGYLTVKYDKIAPFMIQAIKDLKAEIDALKEIIKNGSN